MQPRLVLILRSFLRSEAAALRTVRTLGTGLGCSTHDGVHTGHWTQLSLSGLLMTAWLTRLLPAWVPCASEAILRNVFLIENHEVFLL